MNCKNCGHLKSEHEDLHCNGIHYHNEMREFEKLTYVEKRAKHQHNLRLKKLNHGGICPCLYFIESRKVTPRIPTASDVLFGNVEKYTKRQVAKA